MRHARVLRLKSLLFPALFAVALSSCIGVQSQLSLGRDGSGTLRISYRIAQFLRESQGLPLPASREGFQQAVAAVPGLRLEALSQREDEQDLILEARLGFQRVEDLNGLGDRLGLSYQTEEDRRVFRQRLYAGAAAGGLSAESLGMLETFFPGYEVSLELSSAAPIRSHSLGQLSEDRRVLRFQTTLLELLRQQDAVTLEVAW
jgi:hypothetical protein